MVMAERQKLIKKAGKKSQEIEEKLGEIREEDFYNFSDELME